MKIYSNQEIVDQMPAKPVQGPAILTSGPEERQALLAMVDLEPSDDLPLAEKQAAHYEVRDGYDYLSVFLPVLAPSEEGPTRMEAYLKPGFLVVTADRHLLGKLDGQLAQAKPSDRTPAQALALFFNPLLEESMTRLDQIDDQIDALETLVEADPRERLASILPLRKELLALKHYYQGLREILEEMEANGSQYFSSGQLKVLRAQRKKADRILTSILNLRDYLNQAREALQNQLDIGLNETMRFFTVITAVFLPPTLLVGWYGMNLRMPELDYALTYPLVALASFAFIVLSLIFCKKKGWF